MSIDLCFACDGAGCLDCGAPFTAWADRVAATPVGDPDPWGAPDDCPACDGDGGDWAGICPACRGKGWLNEADHARIGEAA